MDLLLFSVKSLWISSLVILIILLFYCYQNSAKNPAVPIYPLLGILTVLFIYNRRRLIERKKEILVDSRSIHRVIFNDTVPASPRPTKPMFTTFFAPSQPRSGNSNRPFPLLQALLRLEFNQRSLRNFAVDTANKMIARLIPLLTQAAAKKDIVDIQTVLDRFNIDNICKVAVGKDLLTSSKHNPEELLRDVKSFIVAGRETTSSVLTWLFWRLSSRPDVEKKILEEVKLIRAVTNRSFSLLKLIRAVTNRNNNRSFSIDKLRKMNYIDAVVKESLRFYPPVPIDTQWRQEGFIMPSGRVISNHCALTVCVSETRRMEKIWGDPRVFRPERFLQDGGFRQERQYLLPFHGEPSMCTGMEMVYIRTKSIMASMLERFEINAVKKEDPQHLFSMTLRMRGGLPVRVQERA